MSCDRDREGSACFLALTYMGQGLLSFYIHVLVIWEMFCIKLFSVHDLKNKPVAMTEMCIMKRRLGLGLLDTDAHSSPLSASHELPLWENSLEWGTLVSKTSLSAPFFKPMSKLLNLQCSTCSMVSPGMSLECMSNTNLLWGSCLNFAMKWRQPVLRILPRRGC